jgi:HlyD family secretion protein
MKRSLVALAALTAVAAVVWLANRGGGQPSVHYRELAVERGDLAAVVSATGHLEPVVTVQVGTQVSGIIDEIAVDFNDRVRAGQVIARIDTTLLASAVAGATAQRERARAELRHAEREHVRLGSLWAENLVAETEYHAAAYVLDLARAAVAGAEVDLARARQNRAYATITAPIDGMVISRAVDPGQTVQASFAAPELFLIAGDLTQMQILAAVDESDIGQISAGQTARFTVQAHPDDVFAGTVRQVRLLGSTAENVVTYTVVIDVANPDLRLLPGMTATVDFLVETARDVLYVANSALRFRPAETIMQSAIERWRAGAETRRARAGAPSAGAGDGAAGDAGGAASASAGSGDVSAGARIGGGREGGGDRGMLWVLRTDGQLDVIMVRTGISDGVSTVVQGAGLDVGLRVVAGMSSQPVAAATSPFQAGGAQRTGPGPRTPGGF